MEESKVTPQSIDDYISKFTPDIQEILQMIRKVIKGSAPDAEEKISWGMPTFTLHGNLIHFAAHKNHIGLYPSPSGIDSFKVELSEYIGGKGSIRFPIDKPIPYELIGKIVKFRVTENIKMAEDKLLNKKGLKK